MELVVLIQQIAQTTIGILVVWIFLAVATSQVQEWVASIFTWRESMLEDTIVTMLGDYDLKDKVYNHPLIQGLYSNQGKRKPGLIPGDKFALVLFEVFINAENTNPQSIKLNFKSLRAKIDALINSESRLQKVARFLNTLLIGIDLKTGDKTASIMESQRRVESWFENVMVSLVDSYRRRVQIVSIIVSITIAAALNVDTGTIISTLWKDPIISQAVVAQTNQATQAGQTLSTDDILKNIDKLNSLSLPIGWSAKNIPTDANGWVAKIIGILLSGMAAAQGAPYWFDFTRKIVTRNSPVLHSI